MRDGIQGIKLIWLRLCSAWLVLLIALAANPLGARPSTILFGGDTSYPPFEWKDQDGIPKGFLIDLEDAVASAGESNAIHRLAPWPDTVQALRSGAVDVVPMFISEKRAKDFWFSQPVFFAYHAIFTVHDPGQVTNLTDLDEWRVVVESSSFAHDQLTASGNTGEIVLVDNTAEALKALADGRADYAVLAEAPIPQLLQKLGLKVNRVGAPFWSREYAFAVRKDRSELISWMERSLDTTISSGEFQRIQARWQPQLEDHDPSHNHVMHVSRTKIAAVAGAMLTGLVLLLLSLQGWFSKGSRGYSSADLPPAKADDPDSKLLSDFATAAKDDFYAVFQPQLDLPSGQIKGAEALVRWNHPEMGLIGPDEFIPQLEKAGVIGELTSRMIEIAVEQSVLFRDRGRQLRFSVNVSATDFTNLDLPHLVADCLRRAGGCPRDLMLEITESGAITDPGVVRKVIEELQSTGVRVAIDDFGTGFASLANFTELNFDELKVDRFFVERMTFSEGHREAVSSAINMAHRMKMEVVAEGAPDFATIRLLESMGCDKVQSYAVSPPLPAESLFSFVNSFAFEDEVKFHEAPVRKAAFG